MTMMILDAFKMLRFMEARIKWSAYVHRQILDIAFRNDQPLQCDFEFATHLTRSGKVCFHYCRKWKYKRPSQTIWL